MIADVSFIHPKKIVHETVFVFIASMQYLFNRPLEYGRAHKTFEMAQMLSDRELHMSSRDNDENVHCFLEIAYQLSYN